MDGNKEIIQGDKNKFKINFNLFLGCLAPDQALC
jgi:hypothetical protein